VYCCFKLACDVTDFEAFWKAFDLSLVAFVPAVNEGAVSDAVRVCAAATAAVVVAVIKTILLGLHPIFVSADATASWLLILLGNVEGRADAGKAGSVAVVNEGGKPVCDEGRVDVGVHVTEMFAQVRPIFVFDLY
jgi:hypothetical protein